MSGVCMCVSPRFPCSACGAGLDHYCCGPSNPYTGVPLPVTIPSGPIQTTTVLVLTKDELEAIITRAVIAAVSRQGVRFGAAPPEAEEAAQHDSGAGVNLSVAAQTKLFYDRFYPYDPSKVE